MTELPMPNELEKRLFKTSQFYIPSLSSTEIENRISHKPAVILPLGSMEPVGLHSPVGLIHDCTFALSSCISERCNILLAPLFPYSCSKSYRAFPGGVGIKRSIMESIITTLIKEYTFWGIEYIFIFDGTYDSFGIVKCALKRFEKHQPNHRVSLFNWQHEDVFNQLYRTADTGEDYGRKEYGILSLAAFLHSWPDSSIERKKKRVLSDKNVYKRWSKRGQDPDKFQKLFPDCTTSTIQTDIKARVGKELFESIVAHYEKIIHSLIR